MSIRVTCPHCKGVLEAGKELLGTQARCPFCSKVIKVEASPPMVKGAPETVPEPPARREKTPAPRPADEKPVVLALASEKPAGEPERDLSPYSVTSLPVKTPPPPQEKPQVTEEGPVGLVLGTGGQIRKKRHPLQLLVRSMFRRGNPTDVSVVLTGVAAAAVTYLLYLAVIYPIRSTDVGKFLAERGWVQYATVYFTIWAGVVLVVKFWKISQQQASLTYDLLPVDRTAKITPGKVDLVESHIKKIPVNPRKSFLINRLLMALDNFRARKSVPEVSTVLNAQAETDAAVVDTSYAMLKVLIWGIPILGFIGTVIGISEAVNHFTGAVQKADEIKEVKTALQGVTQGLAVAFDTTLLGLILSMVIMFPTNWVQKTEEDLLSTMDQYCNENLLPRLATEAEARREELDLVDPETDGSYQKALMDWQKRLENLETALFEKVVNTLGEVRKELTRKGQLPKEAAS